MKTVILRSGDFFTICGGSSDAYNERDTETVSEQNIVDIKNSNINDSGITIIDIYGGLTFDGIVTNNQVNICNSSVSGNIYGGGSHHHGSAIIKNNTVKISDGSKIKGKVCGGNDLANESQIYDNNLVISGAKNSINGEIKYFDSMIFDASDSKNGDTMLSLVHNPDVDSRPAIGVNCIDSKNLNLSIGDKLTLISSDSDDALDKKFIFKLDGIKTLKDETGRYISSFVKEDENKIVHLSEYAYLKEGKDINLYRNDKDFIIGHYTGVYDESKLRVLGNSEISITSVPESVTKIYGDYSEVEEVAAGGVSVNLDKSNLTLKNVDLIGSYNSAKAENIDITKNILNVSASNIELNSIEGFSHIDFLIDSENSGKMISLNADSVDLKNATVNVSLKKALAEGETVELLSAKKLDLSNDKLTINSQNLDSNLTLKVADTSSKKYVNVGEYGLKNDNGTFSVYGKDVFLTSKYSKNGENISVDKFELTNDLKGFKTIYGAYGADDSDAKDSTLYINEKVDLPDTILVGGKSDGKGEIRNNTLEISSGAAGSKVKDIKDFSKINFSLEAGLDGNSALMTLAADTVNLSNSSINIKLVDAMADNQTVTILDTKELNIDQEKVTLNDVKQDAGMTLHLVDTNSNKYVNVGDYSLKNENGNLSITANEIVLSSKYSNDNKSVAVNKFEITDNLSNFKQIYGAYSADDSDATGGQVMIGQKVNLAETSLIGGKSVGNGAVKDNTLVVSAGALGSKIKSAEKFDKLKFELSSGAIDNKQVLLTSVNAINLGNASLNIEVEENTKFNGKKFVLLNNIENKDSAKILINGEKGNLAYSLDKGNYVLVNLVELSDDKDKLAINTESAAAGGFLDGEGKFTGKKTLVLGNSTASNIRAAKADELSGFEDIYGIYSLGRSEASGATVDIISGIDYSNSRIHGGYNKETGFMAKGNTLSVKALNAKVKGITNFENMKFVLPSETKNGDTMLMVKEAVDMAPTKKVGVEAGSAANLHVDDSVKLIDSEGGIKNFGSQQITISGLTDKHGLVAVDKNALVLSLKKESANNNTKAPVEGISAAVALVNQAGTLAAENLDKNMIAAAKAGDGETATFAGMNGGHLKYETGSYVSADSWNLGFGITQKGLSCKNPDSTYGLLFQYGKSSFSTHNAGGFRGNGDSKMVGAGLMFHKEGLSKYYYQGNAYFGKVDAKWNCSEGGYDDSASYKGLTFGMGHKHKAGDNNTMDVYGRFSYSSVGSMNGNIGGYEYKFDSTDSRSLRFGMRMEYDQKESAKSYWGIAWEHEFDGKSQANVMNLGRTDSPSLKGNTGIVEVGYQWKQGDWNYNINADGSFGKRKGVTGSFNINYNF